MVLRHIEVGADEHPLPGDAALGNQVGQAKNLHGTLQLG